MLKYRQFKERSGRTHDKYGEDDKIGGMQVVSQNGVLGLLSRSVFSQREEFIDLSTTDLQHCEVVKHGKKED